VERQPPPAAPAPQAAAAGGYQPRHPSPRLTAGPDAGNASNVRRGNTIDRGQSKCTGEPPSTLHHRLQLQLEFQWLIKSNEFTLKGGGGSYFNPIILHPLMRQQTIKCGFVGSQTSFCLTLP